MMTPVSFPEQNTVYAKNQPQYLPLPTHRVGDPEGTVVSCWGLSLRERLRLLFTGRLWLQTLTFDHPLQPQLPGVDKPLMKETVKGKGRRADVRTSRS